MSKKVHNSSIYGIKCDICEAPKSHVTQNDAHVTRAKIAFIDQYQGKETKKIFPLEAWGAAADALAAVQVGTTIMFNGTFKNASYTDQQDQTRWYFTFVAFDIATVGIIKDLGYNTDSDMAGMRPPANQDPFAEIPF